MLAFVNAFKKPTSIYALVKKYTSKDVNSVLKQEGNTIAGDPLFREMEITYVSKDGNEYKCEARFIGTAYLDVKWQNNELISVQFKY